MRSSDEVRILAPVWGPVKPGNGLSWHGIPGDPVSRVPIPDRTSVWLPGDGIKAWSEWKERGDGAY